LANSRKNLRCLGLSQNVTNMAIKLDQNGHFKQENVGPKRQI
jgi:hypothetical protein